MRKFLQTTLDFISTHQDALLTLLLTIIFGVFYIFLFIALKPLAIALGLIILLGSLILAMGGIDFF